MATRSKDIQLHHHDPVRVEQHEVGDSRELGRRGVLGKRLCDNGQRDVGISEVAYDYRDLPVSEYQRGYQD